MLTNQNMLKYLIILIIPLVLTGCLNRGNDQAALQPSAQLPPVAVEQEEEQPADENSAAVSPQPQPQTYNVSIDNFQFSPATLTVKKGDRVIWTNNDTANHTVNSNVHPFHTQHPSLNLGFLKPNDSLSWIADETGEWGYHCHLHPSMLGTIIVE